MARSERAKFSRNSETYLARLAVSPERPAPPRQRQRSTPDETEFVGCEQTIYGYFWAFLAAGVWESIRHHLVVMLREGEGREASPTAAIVDTQSVKTTESGGPRGWDAAKRLKGRKRHVAVDTDGLLLGVLVHAADIQDADSLADLLKRVKPLYPWLRAVFADSIYNRLAALLACFLAGLEPVAQSRAIMLILYI